MKLNFPFKAGDRITIYQDWEMEEYPIGTAKLVELHSLGRSFILEDTYPEIDQVVYNYQEWKIDEFTPINEDNTISLGGDFAQIQKIRYIDTIGIANAAEDVESDYTYELPMRDSFIKVNEIEIY